MDTAKDDFYLLSELCGDDTVIIALLIQLVRLEPSKSIVEPLTVCRIAKHGKEISLIVDNLSQTAIKDLVKLLKPVAIEYQTRHISKQILKGSDLINFADTMETLQ